MADPRSTPSGRYMYRASGLIIDSDIVLDKLIPCDTTGKADICISVGATPDEIDQPTYRYGNWMTGPDELLLTVPGTTRLHVRAGRSIVATPHRGASDHDLQAFILSSGFGAVLQQRGLHTQHASGVAANGRAVLFTGKSGMGKSTIAGEMMRRGYPMVTDDIAAIRFDAENTAIVEPGWPGLRLWPDSARQLSMDTTTSIPVRPDMEKAVFKAPEFCEHPLPVTHMFVLSRQAAPSVTITPLVKSAGVTAFAQNTFRRKFSDGMGYRASHFQATVALARQVNVAEIARPDSTGPENRFDLATMADAVEQYLSDGAALSLPIDTCR